MLPTSGKAIKQKVRSMHLGPGFCCLPTFRGCGSTAQPLRGVSACSLDRPWLAMYVNTPGTWVRSLHRQYCQAWLSLYDASTNQILPQAWKNSSTFEQTISALKGSRPPVNYSQGLENPPVTKQAIWRKEHRGRGGLYRFRFSVEEVFVLLCCTSLRFGGSRQTTAKFIKPKRDDCLFYRKPESVDTTSPRVPQRSLLQDGLFGDWRAVPRFDIFQGCGS